jgi:hypothetical protein
MDNIFSKRKRLSDVRVNNYPQAADKKEWNNEISVFIPAVNGVLLS